MAKKPTSLKLDSAQPRAAVNTNLDSSPVAMALIPPSAFDTKRTTQPRWLQRQAERQQYLQSPVAHRLPPKQRQISLEAKSCQHDLEPQPQRHSVTDSTSLQPTSDAATPTHSVPASSNSASPTSPLDSTPTDFHSRASTSGTSTFSTSHSWITSSDYDSNRANTMSPRSTIGRIPAISNDDSPQARKGKAGGTMLSAIDRKKKKTLPKDKPDALRATQGTTSGQDTRLGRSLTGVAPSTDSFVPVQAPDIRLRRKLEPRGASEREDLTHLREFLDANPARPEDKVIEYGPKSRFDWDSDSESETKVSNPNPHARKLHKHKRAMVVAEAKTIVKADDAGNKPVTVKNGSGVKAQEGNFDAPTGFSDLPNNAKRSGYGDKMGSNELTQPGDTTLAGEGEALTPARRARVLKLFDDPLWGRGCGSPGSSNTSAKDFTALSSTTSSRTGTTITNPSLSISSASKDAQANELPNTALSSPGFSNVSWSEHGESSSAVHSDRRTGDGGLSRINSTDPFSGQGVHRKFGNKSGVVALANNNEGARRFNARSNSPSKQDKRSKVREGVELPRLASINSSELAHQATNTAHTPSSTSSATKQSPRGLPKGPWESDWDDAVKWIRKVEKEREAQEAREARQLKADLKKEEKRLKKLKAGKEAVKRGSQMGLTPKKPVQDMTEDEFALVGTAAVTPQNGASLEKKSGVLGAFFTKMLGTKEDQEMQARHIDQQLDKHAALQQLKRPVMKAANESTLKDKAHYESAVQLLDGNDPRHDNSKTIKPFGSVQKHTSTSVTGLGIIAGSLEPPAQQYNFPTVKMSHEGLAPMKPEQDTRTSLAKMAAVDDTTESYRGVQTLQTVEEQESEIPSNADNSDSNRDRPTCENNSIHFGISSTSVPCTFTDRSCSYACLTSNHKIPPQNYADENISSRASIHSDDSIVDRYLNSDDDAGSLYSMEADAMPPPLRIQKSRQVYETKGSYDDPPAGATSPLLNIPVLKVARSSQHLQSSGSNSFIPRRNSTFLDQIQKTSRMQQSQLGAHPAFRDTSSDTDSVNTSILDLDESEIHSSTTSKPASIEFGLGIGAEGFDDEGYATGSVQQHEFKTINCQTKTEEVDQSEGTGVQQPYLPTLTKPNDDESRAVEDLDLQSLRAEVGLAPTRLPSESRYQTHPNHPFTWNHEKVMCWGIHNPENIQPQLPDVPLNHPLNLTRAESQYFNSSPTKSQMAEARMCDNCGVFCCRFANLIITSKIAVSGDLTEHMVRLKAEQRVAMLRTYHPNGIEEYDTFLTCTHCERKTCPSCAKKCTENLCQAFVCSECSDETEVCPVHNFR